MNVDSRAVLSPLSGPAYLLQGFAWLRRPGLRRYLVLPVLGNMLIFVVAAVAIFYGLDLLFDRWLPDGWAWLRWLLFPLIALLLIAAGMFGFTLLAALLLSPFLGRLAEAVETMLDGHPPPPSGLPWWRELLAGLAVELRRLGYAAACVLGVVVLGFIPVVQVATAPLGVLVSAWLLAGEYAGNPLGNRRWKLRQQLALLRRHRLKVLGFGAASFGLTLVPVVNLAVIPASAIGMTLLCRDLLAADTPTSA
jgi:CysZ protein